jgi:hypothetical protein
VLRRDLCGALKCQRNTVASGKSASSAFRFRRRREFDVYGATGELEFVCIRRERLFGCRNGVVRKVLQRRRHRDAGVFVPWSAYGAGARWRPCNCISNPRGHPIRGYSSSRYARASRPWASGAHHDNLSAHSSGETSLSPIKPPFCLRSTGAASRRPFHVSQSRGRRKSSYSLCSRLPGSPLQS